MSHCILQIALDTPLDSLFDYRWACEPGSEPEVGQLALVNFGRREAVGLIVAVKHETDVPADKLKDALAVRSQLSRALQTLRAHELARSATLGVHS